MISVGADNPYGHPTADTLVHARASTASRPCARTRQGEIDIDVERFPVDAARTG